MSDRGARARAPLAWRVAAAVLVTFAARLVWLEVVELQHPDARPLQLALRAGWIVVLCLLAVGLWRHDSRARSWAIGLFATRLACYVLMAAIVRYFEAEEWDAATWFGPGPLLLRAADAAPLLLLLWPSRPASARP